MKKPVIIAVAGGSASGKTTVVDKIIARFEKENVTVIKHDDYYKDQSEMAMEERVKVNYDHPFSLDNDLMFKQILKLVTGETITKPTYDFENHNRSKVTETVKPTAILILEGILILNCDEDRSQLKNKEIVTKRFLAIIEQGLHIPKIRKSTKIPKSVIRKRIKDKKNLSEIKKNRKRPEF